MFSNNSSSNGEEAYDDMMTDAEIEEIRTALKNENIIDLFILFLTLFGNIIVIIAILRERRLRTSTVNYLVINLSVCNSLMVLTSIPFTFAMWLRNDYYSYMFGRVGCKVIEPLATLSVNAAVATMLCITLDCYIAFVHPLKLRNQRRYFYKYIFKVIAIIYVYAIVTVIPLGVSEKYTKTDDIEECEESWSAQSKQIYTVVLFLLQYLIPLLVMVMLYTQAWIALKRHNDRTITLSSSIRSESRPRRKGRRRKTYRRKSMVSRILEKHFDFIPTSQQKQQHQQHQQQQQSDTTPDVIVAERRKQTLRTFIMFFLIVTVFAISFLPNQIYWIGHVFYQDKTASIITSNVRIVFKVLHYTNCMLNPIIYGGLNKYFLRAYKSLLFCTKFNNTRSSFRSTRSAASTINQPSHRNTSTTSYDVMFEDGILTANQPDNYYESFVERLTPNPSKINSQEDEPCSITDNNNDISTVGMTEIYMKLENLPESHL